MASKHTQPALYEKMGRASAGPVGSAPPPRPKMEASPPPASASGANPLASLLTPGRTVRLPVGYLLLGGGVMILVIWFAFMLGHNKGEGEARTQFEQSVLDQTGDIGTDGSLITLDPLNDQPSAGTQTPGQSPPKTNPKPSAGTSTAVSGKWGPVVPKTNPCKKGELHFVLAETTESGAKALADFCRGKGLETYVISGKNERLRRVVAFPGFVNSAYSSSAVKALEAKIHQVGQVWKATNRSNSDLRDAYPKVIVP